MLCQQQEVVYVVMITKKKMNCKECNRSYRKNTNGVVFCYQGHVVSLECCYLHDNRINNVLNCKTKQ